MWPFKKKPLAGENPYEGLRQQALHIEITPEIENGMAGHPVYAAVVDMDMNEAISTLVCVADGTTSLYFSNGGGQFGLGQASVEVRNAAIAFLHSSEQVLERLQAANEFPLPQNGLHRVYLFTKDGALFQEYDMKQSSGYSKEMSFLNFLYQNVLAAIGKMQTSR